MYQSLFNVKMFHCKKALNEIHLKEKSKSSESHFLSEDIKQIKDKITDYILKSVRAKLIMFESGLYLKENT